MEKLKEFDAKQFVEKFMEESVGGYIAFEELALAAYTYGVEQALATLEQPGNDPEYLTALESGLDNETQEQFIERTGIVQQPSVRPVTGNAPPRCPACGGEMLCDFCGTPDQASERGELPPSAKVMKKWREDYPITDDMDHVYAHVAGAVNSLLDDLEVANGDSEKRSQATPDLPTSSAAEQPQASERPASKER